LQFVAAAPGGVIVVVVVITRYTVWKVQHFLMFQQVVLTAALYGIKKFMKKGVHLFSAAKINNR
jgi:hypothetical protein